MHYNEIMLEFGVVQLFSKEDIYIYNQTWNYRMFTNNQRIQGNKNSPPEVIYYKIYSWKNIQ